MIIGISLKIFMFLAIVTGIIIATHDGNAFPERPGIIIALTCYISWLLIFVLISVIIIIKILG